MRTTPVCAYCYKLWPEHKGAAKDLPDDIAKEIREHVQVCAKNPLVQQVCQLQTENKWLRGALEKTKENLTIMCPGLNRNHALKFVKQALKKG